MKFYLSEGEDRAMNPIPATAEQLAAFDHFTSRFEEVHARFTALRSEVESSLEEGRLDVRLRRVLGQDLGGMKSDVEHLLEELAGPPARVAGPARKTPSPRGREAGARGDDPEAERASGKDPSPTPPVGKRPPGAGGKLGRG